MQCRNRDSPVGYKLSLIPFESGEPVAASDNKTSTADVLSNADISRCPRNCFRPVGIAFDQQGRLFMSSDATGEIYVVMRNETSEGNSATTPSDDPSATPSAASGTSRCTAWSVCGLGLALGLFSIVI